MRSAQSVSSPRVLLLATQVFSVNGGVPVYMRRLMEVFASYVEQNDGTSGVVALERVSSNGRPKTALLRGAPVKSAYIQAAFRTAWEMKPHLVVAGHVGLAPVAWLLNRAHLARNFAVVLHGTEAWRRCDWTDRSAARDAAALVATTHYTAECFALHNGASHERLRVIPLGLGDCETAGSGPARKRAAGDLLRVLTVSRLSSADNYKGIDCLIEAVALLRQRNFTVHLDVAGTGDDRPRLEALASARGVASRVCFHGSVPDERLCQLYTACDVFALPSKGEGFGIVFLEAMRYGKPCIGGNHGGVPEVIDHGVNGLLVEHGDAGQLAGALSQLGESPARLAELGRRARDKVASRYLFPAFAANWHRFLDEMLGHGVAVSGLGPVTALRS